MSNRSVSIFLSRYSTFLPVVYKLIQSWLSLFGWVKMGSPESTKASHYDDVIMTMLASQITSLTVVYSIVYSGVNQRKHQSSGSLAFVREIHRGSVNFPHKWPVTRKMFPFDDVIMIWTNVELGTRASTGHQRRRKCITVTILSLDALVTVDLATLNDDKAVTQTTISVFLWNSTGGISQTRLIIN